MVAYQQFVAYHSLDNASFVPPGYIVLWVVPLVGCQGMALAPPWCPCPDDARGRDGQKTSTLLEVFCLSSSGLGALFG